MSLLYQGIFVVLIAEVYDIDQDGSISIAIAATSACDSEKNDQIFVNQCFL